MGKVLRLEIMQTNFSLKLSRFLVYLAIFLIPFYFFRFSIGPLRTNVFEVAVFAAFLYTLYEIRYTKKVVWGSIWPYLFLLISFVSIFFVSDRIMALGIFKGWFLVPIILYFLILNLFMMSSSGRQRPRIKYGASSGPGIQDIPQRNFMDSRFHGNDKNTEEYFKLIVPIFVSFTIVGIWSLLQSLGLITVLFYQKGDVSFFQYLSSNNFRIFGPFESPNFLAMFLAPVFFLSLPILGYAKKISKTVFFLALIPFAIAVYDLLMTGSRAGIVAFTIPFVILVLNKTQIVSASGRQRPRLRGNDNKKWLTAIALLIVILMFCLILIRVSTDRSESNSSRLQIYHYSLEIGQASPVSGIGLGSFYQRITEISRDDIDFQVKVLPYALHPHNIYLAMWLNLGFLGLILFLIIVGTLFHRLLSLSNNFIAACLMAAMVAILIHGLFDTTYFKNDLSAFFWLILALVELITLHKNAES